jgi:hypothetical protein
MFLEEEGEQIGSQFFLEARRFQKSSGVVHPVEEVSRDLDPHAKV